MQTSNTYIQEELFQWDFAETAGGIRGEAVQDTKEAVNAAHTAYLIKVEEERKAAEEAQRLAEEQAAAEARAAEEAAAAQAAAEAQAASVAASEQELLAALIYCEAGNQPYEGQVAVGAVVMNRVKSGAISEYDHRCDLSVRTVRTCYDRVAGFCTCQRKLFRYGKAGGSGCHRRKQSGR